jgi:DNA-binding response OmpR family regulator
MKVFIVDDDAQMVTLMTALLEAAGHTVSSEITGSYAIPRIVSERPDCVIIDLMMAELDGLELCQELRGRKETRGATLVIVTARDETTTGAPAPRRAAWTAI